MRDRARPEYDPLGLRFGGFDLHASVDLGVTSTDNLFATQTNEQDDIVYSVAPRARLASHWSRHALAVEGGFRATSHQDFSSEDAETGYVHGYGRLDIGSNSNVSATAGIAHEVEPRTDPDSVAVGPPVEYDRTDLGIQAQHNFNRFRVTVGASNADYNFDGAQSVRDNEINALRGRVDAEVTPRIGVFLEGQTDERDYDVDAPFDLDSEGQTILAGATINFTDLMKGEIALGQFERDYDDPALGSTDGLAVAANLEWYITRLTTLSFNASRDAEDVVGANNNLPYVATNYGARIDHELFRNVILTAGVGFGDREYDVIDRSDDFSSAEVGFDYLLNRRVAVEGRYRHEEVESDGVNAYRDYEVNTLSLGLSLRL